MNKRWKCVCGDLHTEQEVEDATVCIDYGDRYQPPEHASYCVSCGKDHEHQDEVWICGFEDWCEADVEDGTESCIRHNLEADGFAVCNGCDKMPVPDEGELCAECYTCKLEHDADAYNDAQLEDF